MVGMKKDYPQSFIDRTVKPANTDFSRRERSDDLKYICVRWLKPSGTTLRIFNVLFFISANISLCNSASLIKTSYVATPVYDFYYIILILPCFK